MKLTAIIALLAALFLASTALADDNAGLRMWAGSTSGNARYVTFSVKLTADTDQSGPGGSVVFVDCKAGLGLPLPVEPSAYHFPAGTSLYANKLGEVQWNFDGVPPRSAKPLILRLTYAVPQHARPYSVCLRAEALQNVSDIRLGANMRYFLKTA